MTDQSTAPSMHATAGFRPVDEASLQTKVDQLTLEQKVRLLTGADNWAIPAESAIGLRQVVMSDGPNGVRGLSWRDESNVSLLLPNVAAMAATWDEVLFVEVGQVLGDEAHRKGIDLVLGPGVNLHRTPLGGRNFEYFSEDPLLTAKLATAYVVGLQEKGISACVKHYVLNETEEERKTYNVDIDERTMREAQLLPFEMTVKVGAASLMASYNKLDGEPMTGNPRMNFGVLKGEWGFDGALISDWHATWADKPAAIAGGLDISMPGPDPEYSAIAYDLVRSGKLAESVVDASALRILRLAARVGGFEPAADKGPDHPPAAAVPWLRDVAARSMTLLKNDTVDGAALLPLAAGPKRVAIIGPMAKRPTYQGGGSACVTPPYVVAPIEPIRAAFGDGVEIVYAEGTPASRLLPDFDLAEISDPTDGTSGLCVTGFSADGEELINEHRDASKLLWSTASAGALATGVARIVVRFRLAITETGEHRLALSGCGEVIVAVGTRATAHIDIGTGTPGNFEIVVHPNQVIVPFAATAGETIDVEVTRLVTPEDYVGFLPLGFGHAKPSYCDRAGAIDEAVALAKSADLVLLFIGNTDEDEAEGYDRPSLSLPGRQDELAAGVLAANRRTVVVLNASSAVTMPWIAAASAAIWTGLGGQEYGNALADVLFGVNEPAGRLPATFPVQGEDAPVLSASPRNGRHTYSEGLRLGHRGYAAANRRPLFAFGHGLGYGRWTYEAAGVAVHPGADPADLGSIAAIVSVTLRNDADRASREVVQIYAEAADGDDEAAPLSLVGFTVATAGAGETISVSVPILARSLGRYGKAGWESPKGVRVLKVARSAVDPRLTIELPALG
ncbi:MAG: glycoside hydrolase family 3 C-terminal domain-containing protein [Ancalomicrobiaceae bacterium]|nr:glycoside hydrolase family 3 C-terminal domain-containing protein [Ancalomicrobiaceae bacterium]